MGAGYLMLDKQSNYLSNMALGILSLIRPISLNRLRIFSVSDTGDGS